MEGAKEDVTTDRKYSNVQPMYKAGCRGCTSPEYTPDLCSQCKEVSQTCDTSELMDLIKHHHKEDFPELPFDESNGSLQSDNDIVMKNILKRGRSSAGGETSSKILKT